MDRAAHVRRGLWLNYATIGYNSLEGIIAIGAGVFAGSVALVGFGVDSVIEVSSGVAAQWRLRADLDPIRREKVEKTTLRIIGASFLALAAYVLYDAAVTLWRREAPDESRVGIALAAVSVVVMPLLARAKRKVAVGLGSRALHADAQQTSLCTYLSAILLGGLALNAIVGLVVGGPPRRVVHGADHRQGRHRGPEGRRSLCRLRARSCALPTRGLSGPLQEFGAADAE
jgi:divalent metal cation (Fe/Co/Zn/Cd) transporter